jgi:glutathione S-transferase
MATEAQPKIKLHWLNQSRAESLVWLLEALNTPYEVETFRRQSNRLAPPELEKIHPLGKSPVVTVTPAEVGAEPIVLAETGFMTEYLLDHFDTEKKLVPARWKAGKEGTVGGETDAWMRYEYLMHYREGTLMPIIVITLVISRLRSTMIPFFIRPITSAVAGRILDGFVLPNARKNLAMLEGMLDSSAGKYLCGETLTAADILVAFPLMTASGVLDSIGSYEGGGGWKNEFPRLAEYADRMAAEETYLRAQEKVKELDEQSKSS